MFSLDVLRLLRTVMSGVTLQAGAPDFAEMAPVVVRALAELDAAIADAERGSD